MRNAMMTAILCVALGTVGLIALYQYGRIGELKGQLETAQLTLVEKENEKQREQTATVFRDEEFEKYDKRLADIQRSLRKLHTTSEEMRAVLSIVIPGDALRGVRGYSGYRDESESTRAPSTATKTSHGAQ